VTLNYQKAIAKDTTTSVRLDLIKEAVENSKKAGNKPAAAYWQGQLYATIKSPTNTDLYNWGFAYYSAGNFLPLP
ncbi:MAG TPA: hypothetical protein VE035_17640, partial [Puia sp.]|nr:hypothetical protein [Puia sp.]